MIRIFDILQPSPLKRESRVVFCSKAGAIDYGAKSNSGGLLKISVKIFLSLTKKEFRFRHEKRKNEEFRRMLYIWQLCLLIMYLKFIDREFQIF